MVVANAPGGVRIHRALAGWSRVAVLTELRSAEAPLDVRELAARTGLHSTTVRFHLDVLAEASLVRPATERQARRGRPRQLWAAVDQPEPAAGGGFQLLARMLASYMAANLPEPSVAGAAAGAAWGAYLTESGRPFTTLSEPEAVARITVLLDQLGFAPEAGHDAEGLEIKLHRCPFGDVAEDNQSVVCSAHLGLLQGALSEMGAPVTATRLDPLVEPSLCIAHLAPADAAAGSAEDHDAVG